MNAQEQITSNTGAQSRVPELMCGVAVSSSLDSSDLAGLFVRLRIDVEEIDSILRGDPPMQDELFVSATFPFLIRKYLELCGTCLLARIDPLRVLAARKNQEHESFTPGKANPQSITWSGDIVPRRPPVNSTDPWDSKQLENGVERSLLGWHVGDLALTPGLRWVVDETSADSSWLKDLRSKDDGVAWIKGQIGNLYSTLSKGVHSEYLTDVRNEFDRLSIDQHLRDAYKLTTLLAVASHASPLFSRSMGRKNALDVLLAVETKMTNSVAEK